MTELLVVVAMKLIIVHGLDGHTVMVNPRTVTQLAARKSSPSRLVNDRVNCIIGFTDGKFISVIESCDEVHRMMEGK